MKKNAVLPFLMVTLMITSGCSKGAADAVTKGDFEAMSEVIKDTSETESAAEGALVNAKTSGYDSAYIKFSGKRVMHRIYYTVYSHDVMDFSKDQVVISGVSTTSMMGDDEKEMTLIIDKDTTFDPSCNMSFFGNYEKGQSVLEWFLKNDELAKFDPDSYSSGGPALLGIFDVAITGDHVDRIYR